MLWCTYCDRCRLLQPNFSVQVQATQNNTSVLAGNTDVLPIRFIKPKQTTCAEIVEATLVSFAYASPLTTVLQTASFGFDCASGRAQLGSAGSPRAGTLPSPCSRSRFQSLSNVLHYGDPPCSRKYRSIYEQGPNKDQKMRCDRPSQRPSFYSLGTVRLDSQTISRYDLGNSAATVSHVTRISFIPTPTLPLTLQTMSVVTIG